MEIYLAALELGLQPASVIARKAGLKRVDTYNHLRKLCGIGIFRVDRKDGVTFFTTCSPERLVCLIKIKKHIIAEVEKNLSRMVN
jgi:hypothetical protein